MSNILVMCFITDVFYMSAFLIAVPRRTSTWRERSLNK